MAFHKLTEKIAALIDDSLWSMVDMHAQSRIDSNEQSAKWSFSIDEIVSYLNDPKMN